MGSGEKVCKNCGTVWNRDIVACLNLIKIKDVPVCVTGERMGMTLTRKLIFRTSET